VQTVSEPIPIDVAVAIAFAELVAEARRLERRPKIMDTCIAATAVALDLQFFNRDEDFRLIPRVQIMLV
jgi:predicted nucleic acid-binding protein